QLFELPRCEAHRGDHASGPDFSKGEKVGTPRCGVPARKAGGTNDKTWEPCMKLRRYYAARTAQRAVPTNSRTLQRLRRPEPPPPPPPPPPCIAGDEREAPLS